MLILANKRKVKPNKNRLQTLLYTNTLSFFQMSTLFLMVLYGALWCASSNSTPDNIETLMDNGWCLFLHWMLYFKFWFDLLFMCMCFSSIIKPVLVLRVPSGVGTTVPVPLTCGEAYQTQSVFWKKDGNTPASTSSIISVSVLYDPKSAKACPFPHLWQFEALVSVFHWLMSLSQEWNLSQL